ncbi:MAG: hypothetical protein K0R48_1224 [Gammaproteobacteria bacterium]|jgi:hypothetical protein|nr:hypothetical protein [Gammaproteobacteria bacterium]
MTARVFPGYQNLFHRNDNSVVQLVSFFNNLASTFVGITQFATLVRVEQSSTLIVCRRIPPQYAVLVSRPRLDY